MSADSPRKSLNPAGNIVLPQPVSDRSIIESVAGFINEVVPQSYTSLPLTEAREVITWARFEYADINDPSIYPDTSDDRNGTPPLLLILGYGNGVQVWAIPASGEAMEVLSWRQGVVRTLRILPTPEISDQFSHKRPLIALCDSAGPGPHFCSLSFISLRYGEQVKSIKFKNPVSDVLANRRSIVVTFPERVAVFDAATLEDRLTVTTCYPCPGPNPNPVALGSRWLAYASRRLQPARRSSGGSEGDGVQSYTAAVLHAAKSLGKGLRGLGETVASSLSAQQRGSPLTVGFQATSSSGTSDSGLQPGVITIIDVQSQGSTRSNERERCNSDEGTSENMIAHFTAHSEPVVALAFDPSGMLLLTADRRGHDFHLFRIQPHPCGSSLAAVHHLYTLHRGDTTAKVQDIAFATDSRWVAVSTLRGTTHVFPITPYGGPVGTRTHATPHVVNRLSRFHRSAGLTGDATATGRNSPVPESVTTPPPPSVPYRNPRLPPYPHPTIVQPLAQVRQPSGVQPSSAPASPLPTGPQQTQHHQQHQHQGYGRNPLVRRTHSASSDDAIPLRVAACFGPPRAWLAASPTAARENPGKANKRAVDCLFVMACHGSLVEYSLEPRHAAAIPKEKVCDDTPIELSVYAKAQWVLLRSPLSPELSPPLLSDNPLLALPERPTPHHNNDDEPDADERWLSQVEIVTHAGPHRRLWMGPQFTFKTYNGTPGTPFSVLDIEAVDISNGTGSRPARSNPMNMPISTGGTRPIVPVLIESGSSSSYEQSPRLMEVYGGDGIDSDGSVGPGEIQLREDLADAMMESPGVPIRDTGRRLVVGIRSSPIGKRSSNPVEKVVNPVGTVITVSMPSDEEGSSTVSDKSLKDLKSHVPKEDKVMNWPTTVKLTEQGEACESATALLVCNVPQGGEKSKENTTRNFMYTSKERKYLEMETHSINESYMNECVLSSDRNTEAEHKQLKTNRGSSAQAKQTEIVNRRKERDCSIDSRTERQANDNTDVYIRSKKNCTWGAQHSSKIDTKYLGGTKRTGIGETTDSDKSVAQKNLQIVKSEFGNSDNQNKPTTDLIHYPHIKPSKLDIISVQENKENCLWNPKTQGISKTRYKHSDQDIVKSDLIDNSNSVFTNKTESCNTAFSSSSSENTVGNQGDSSRSDTKSQVSNYEKKLLSSSDTRKVSSPLLWSKVVSTPAKEKQHCQADTEESVSSIKLENSGMLSDVSICLEQEKYDLPDVASIDCSSPTHGIKKKHSDIVSFDKITQRRHIESTNVELEDSNYIPISSTSISVIKPLPPLSSSPNSTHNYSSDLKETDEAIIDNSEKSPHLNKTELEAELVSENIYFNDEDGGSDAGNTSSQSSKKSRRSKKKRR